MWSRLIGAFILAALPQISASQAVPEGVHRETRGPITMCGLMGRNVSDLVRQARRSPELRSAPISSDRFELFETAKPKYQLVVTKPSEAAYPAASCRHLFEEGGSLKMKRDLRCEAGRKECDALFLEFQALDDDFKEALRVREQDLL